MLSRRIWIGSVKHVTGLACSVVTCTPSPARTGISLRACSHRRSEYRRTSPTPTAQRAWPRTCPATVSAPSPWIWAILWAARPPSSPAPASVAPASRAAGLPSSLEGVGRERRAADPRVRRGARRTPTLGSLLAGRCDSGRNDLGLGAVADRRISHARFRRTGASPSGPDERRGDCRGRRRFGCLSCQGDVVLDGHRRLG